MGVLGAAAASGNETPTAEANEPEPEAPESAPEADAAPEPPTGVERPRPPSRRQQETENVVRAHLKQFQEEQARVSSTYQQQIQQQAQELANLRGQLEAVQRQPAPAPVATPAGPDPDALYREAEQLVAAGDMQGYHRKMREASEAIAEIKAEAKARALRDEVQKQIPQQMPAEIQYLMSQHKNVALAGRDGIEAVMLAERELAIYKNFPPGPQRVAAAFAEAERRLAEKNKPPARQPTFDPAAAQALAAVPTGRPAASNPGGGGEKEPLSELEKQVARAAKMSEDDYRKWKNPAKWMR